MDGKCRYVRRVRKRFYWSYSFSTCNCWSYIFSWSGIKNQSIFFLISTVWLIGWHVHRRSHFFSEDTDFTILQYFSETFLCWTPANNLVWKSAVASRQVSHQLTKGALLDPFHATVIFPYPLKRFHVFREYLEKDQWRVTAKYTHFLFAKFLVVGWLRNVSNFNKQWFFVHKLPYATHI